MKKGFTLIELLAVIVILAIIAIIATPIILNIIEDTKEQSVISSANLYVDGLTKHIVSKNMVNEFNPSSCTISNGIATCDGVVLDYTVDGDKPSSGTISFNNGIVTEYALSFTDYTVTKDQNGVSATKGSIPEEPLATDVTTCVTSGCDKTALNTELTIGSEHFYVLASDNTNTYLLAKYNLYVGIQITKICTSADCATLSTSYNTISKSDSNYGLQSELARAFNYITPSPTHSAMTGVSSTSYGFVSFSGTNYWDNSVCAYVNTSNPNVCEGTPGLLSDYSNASNTAGATTYVSVYPYVYNESMSTAAPVSHLVNTQVYVENNGYTIAYYVEEYLEKLKELGAPNTISGRLLTYEEANSLSSDIKGNQAFWCGSAERSDFVYNFSGWGRLSGSSYFHPTFGVRPVIIIPTASL